MAYDMSPAARGGSLKGFVEGFTLPARAASLLLSTPKIKRYAVAPLVVNVIVYAIAIGVAAYLVSNWDLSVPAWNFLWGVGGWLSSALNWLLAALKWVVAIPLIAIICYFTFTAVGMLVATPFNDILSDRVERTVCGEPRRPSVTVWHNATATLLSSLDALWIVARQVVFMALTLPLLLIPIVGFVPLFTVTAYFTGLGFVDTSMARNFLRHRHKKPVIAANRWQVLGLGLAMELLFLIPFAGLFLLPVGVTAGTLLYCTWEWNAALKASGLEPPAGYAAPVPLTDA